LAFYDTESGKINAIEFFPSNKSSDDDYTTTTNAAAEDSSLLCIHGFCHDARVFTYIGNKLSKEGYNVVSIDLPGHGKSDGERGNLDFGKCIKSIHQIVEELKKRSNRVFILAHSAGGIFALWYAHLFRGSIDGLILLSPHVRVRNMKKRFDAEPNTLQFLVLLLGRIFVPRKRLYIPRAFPEYVKVGGNEVAWMMKDPQANFSYTYQYLVDILAMRSSKLAELSDIGDIPVVILHGKKDRHMYPQVSEEFFKLLRTNKKEIKVVDCDHWFCHSIFYDQALSPHSEESRMQIVSSVVDWLKSADGRSK
jgi:lysophospholipase